MVRGFAGVDAPVALSIGMTYVELAADTELTGYLAVPAGETPRFRECRPYVVDARVKAILHASDPLAVLQPETADDAFAWACVTSHSVLLRSQCENGRLLETHSRFGSQ